MTVEIEALDEVLRGAAGSTPRRDLVEHLAVHDQSAFHRPPITSMAASSPQL